MSTIADKSTFINFRERCEDKNTINQKGTMYVGTGNTTDALGDGTKVSITTSTPQPGENMLLVKDNSVEGGLNWWTVEKVLSDANVAGQNTTVKQADNATTSLDAINVSQTINKNSISDIFEEDGITVKKSTMSENTLSTDFTNSEWIWAGNAESGVDLVKGGTYEICIYGNKVAQVIIGYYIITIEANPSNFGIFMTIKNSFSPASLSSSEWEIHIQKTNVTTRRTDTAYSYDMSSGKFSVSNTTQQYLDFKYRRIR